MMTTIDIATITMMTTTTMGDYDVPLIFHCGQQVGPVERLPKDRKELGQHKRRTRNIQLATLTPELRALRGFLRANGGSVSIPGTRTRRRRLSGLSLRLSLMAVRKTHWDLGEGTREHDTTCMTCLSGCGAKSLESFEAKLLRASRCPDPTPNPPNLPNPQDQCERRPSFKCPEPSKHPKPARPM